MATSKKKKKKKKGRVGVWKENKRKVKAFLY